MDRFLASSGYNTGGIDRTIPSIKHNKPTRMQREIGFVIEHMVEDTLFWAEILFFRSSYFKLVIKRNKCCHANRYVIQCLKTTFKIKIELSYNMKICDICYWVRNVHHSNSRQSNK